MIMKSTLIIFVILFFSCNLKGQNLSDLDSLINKSLVYYLENRKELNRKTIVSDSYFKNLYLLIDNFPRNIQFCEEVQKMQIPYISLINPPIKHMKKGNNYYVIFLNMTLQNNKLDIMFTDSVVTLVNKKSINQAISDWGIYTFEYSCQSQQWILVETKYSGI